MWHEIQFILVSWSRWALLMQQLLCISAIYSRKDTVAFVSCADNDVLWLYDAMTNSQWWVMNIYIYNISIYNLTVHRNETNKRAVDTGHLTLATKNLHLCSSWEEWTRAIIQSVRSRNFCRRDFPSKNLYRWLHFWTEGVGSDSAVL